MSKRAGWIRGFAAAGLAGRLNGRGQFISFLAVSDRVISKSTCVSVRTSHVGQNDWAESLPLLLQAEAGRIVRPSLITKHHSVSSLTRQAQGISAQLVMRSRHTP